MESWAFRVLAVRDADADADGNAAVGENRPRAAIADAVATVALEGIAPEGRRLLLGALLGGAFGIAVGARAAFGAMILDGIGVAAGMLAVCAVAVPALAILLALFDASIGAIGILRATARGTMAMGLTLAGIAPAALLFALTLEDDFTVRLFAAGALLLGGALGARTFLSDLEAPLFASARPQLARVAVHFFILFAAVLAGRVWWLALPLLGGAS